jgi:hypothetical protein
MNVERPLTVLLCMVLLGATGCGKFKRAKECNAFIDKVNVALKDIEKRTSAPEGDEKAAVGEMRELAKLYEKLSQDIAALGITSQELKKQAADYQQMATKAAGTARQVADAIEGKDIEKATAAQKQFDLIVKEEDQLVSSINQLCHD